MDALSQYIKLYQEHKETINSHAPEALNRQRAKALSVLISSQLPKKGDEGYPALSVDEMFAPDYGVNINRVNFPVNPAETFHCGVPNISTLLGIVANDTFMPTESLLRNMPEGVKVMSLAKAAEQNPQWVEKYYNKLAMAASDDCRRHVAAALNTLLAQDGVLVHISQGIKLEKPIQIVNIFNTVAPVMAVRRLLVVIEDDAQASLLLCDHSANQEVNYLNSQVAEIYMGRNAKLGYYDLEESSALTSRHCDVFARQDEGSELIINGTTLIGGQTRNYYEVELAGEHASTKLAGMAVGADEQIVDNATCVKHNTPKCESDQMFKYILDQRSKGSFYGTIIVDEKAKYTKAYQSNRNILASTEAKMYTRPQLEIYCDEVKCSHGATVGQLDANALFYMRSRGIPEAEAKMMLMQAFMADVIDTVTIPALKSRLHQLVERRLAGELELCSDCNQCEI